MEIRRPSSQTIYTHKGPVMQKTFPCHGAMMMLHEVAGSCGTSSDWPWLGSAFGDVTSTQTLIGKCICSTSGRAVGTGPGCQLDERYRDTNTWQLYTGWHGEEDLLTSFNQSVSSINHSVRQTLNGNIYLSLSWWRHQMEKFSALLEFPAQRASNAENVTIWWRHHAFVATVLFTWWNRPSQYCRTYDVMYSCRWFINVNQIRKYPGWADDTSICI